MIFHKLCLHCDLSYLSLKWTESDVFSFTGDIQKACTVNIVKDSRYEGEEKFRLVLGSPQSEAQGGARIGQVNETTIIIADEEDSE